MKRILVATDGSQPATEAVELAVELASEHGCELHIVHVVPILDVVPSVGFGAITAALPHEVSAHDRELLDDALALAREQGVTAMTQILRGDTVDEIVACADSHDVDLLVVGSRGHGAIASSLLGSVSRGVLAETKRPVLIVRAARVTAPVGAS